MKNIKIIKIIALLLLVFMIGQGTAVAASWTYIQRLEGTRMGPCGEYLDTESVVKTGQKLVYWTIWLLDAPGGKKQVRKILRKNEALLNDPKQIRALETYQYDINDAEVYQSLQPSMFTELTPDSAAYRALQHARQDDGSDSAKPNSIDVRQ